MNKKINEKTSFAGHTKLPTDAPLEKTLTFDTALDKIRQQTDYPVQQQKTGRQRYESHQRPQSSCK
jgi:hypothetical protein